MTACLHWTPDRVAAVEAMAREVGQQVKRHRTGRGMSKAAYSRRYGFRSNRLWEIEEVKKPNLTLNQIVRLLEPTGYTIAVVPKVSP